jgi:NRPS condensation-like uncharacterized protein
MGNFYMTSAIIPDRFTTVDGDMILSLAIDAGNALFTGNLEMSFDYQLDAERLSRALDLTLDAQPILGCKFFIDGRQMYWERLSKEERHSLYVFENESEFEQFKTAQIDSRTGPQIQVGLYRRSAGDCLIIKHSHQEGDGGGVFDITRELTALYNRLKHEPAYQPEPNIHGSRSGKQILRKISWTAFPVIMVNFIKLMWSNNHPKTTHTLSLPACQKHTPWMYTIRHITPVRAARALEYGKKRLATMNDVLITAYLRALAKVGRWDGQSALRIRMLVDLRKWYLPENHAEGICNLSAFEHVNLSTDLGNDFDATLGRVSAITRSRKNSYIGLTEVWLAPLVTWLPYRLLVRLEAQTRRKKVMQKRFPDTITNVGAIPPESVTFDKQPVAAWVLPPVYFPPPFLVCFSSYAGSITLSAGVFQGSAAIIDELIDQMVNELPD